MMPYCKEHDYSSRPDENGCEETVCPYCEIATLRAELAEARREWRDLALLIARSFDDECTDADWEDIVGTFDPWDCVKQSAIKLAEAKKDSARLSDAIHILRRVASLPMIHPSQNPAFLAVGKFLDRDDIRAAIDEEGAMPTVDPGHHIEADFGTKTATVVADDEAGGEG